MRQVKFAITTDGSGNYTSTTDGGAQNEVVGRAGVGPLYLEAVEWIVNSLTSGVDAVLSVTATTSGTDKTLLTLTNANSNAWYYPRVLGSDNAGSALTGWYVRQVVEGTLKLAVTSGGASHAGTVIVYLTDKP